MFIPLQLLHCRYPVLRIAWHACFRRLSPGPEKVLSLPISTLVEHWHPTATPTMQMSRIDRLQLELQLSKLGKRRTGHEIVQAHMG